MNYASLVINTRRQVDDARSIAWSTADVGFWLNEAARLIQDEMKIAKIIRSFSLVANQRRYVLDDEVSEPVRSGMIFNESETHLSVHYQDLGLFNSHQTTLGATPQYWTFIDDERAIYLWPTPDTAAGTQTLNGALNATATSITMNATTAFSNTGRGIVDSEVLSWENTTATVLQGVRRGLEGTTAASHANGATMTERDIIVYGVLRIRNREMRRYHTVGTATFTNGSATVTGASSPAWNIGENVIAGIEIAPTADATTTDPLRWYIISTVDSATQVTLTENFDDDTASASAYIASDLNPLPAKLDSLLVLYAASMMLKREGETKLSEAYLRDFELRFRRAKAGAIKSDELLYPLGRRDALVNIGEPRIALLGANYPLVR